MVLIKTTVQEAAMLKSSVIAFIIFCFPHNSPMSTLWKDILLFVLCKVVDRKQLCCCGKALDDRRLMTPKNQFYCFRLTAWSVKKTVIDWDNANIVSKERRPGQRNNRSTIHE